MKASEPRLILVCCEGQTEKNYFTIVKTVRRITSVQITIESFNGKSGNSLIDTCVEQRLITSHQWEIDENEVEVWAVFDKDSYTGTFTELEQYARTKNVRLAYSDPQFETYLLQHFGQDASTLCGRRLEARLTQQMQQSNSNYGSYAKPDLCWLSELLDNKPRTLEVAITNSKLRANRTKTPFLTVHTLTERLLQFEPRRNI